MQEAYRVGIAIALSGDVGTIINKLAADFERLDRAVGASKEGMGSLTNALKGMAAEGKAAADSWQNVAKAIQQSAKAAREAAAAGASMRESASRQRATSYAQDAINAANAANQSRRSSPDSMLVPVYQQRGRYGDQSSGPTVSLPYESSRRDLAPAGTAAAPRIYTYEPDALEGEIITPSGRRALPPGANPYGPTINGSWTRPGGSGPTYGPYWPRAAGGAPAVPGGGNGGMMPPGGGGPGGPGGGMPPLNYPYWVDHFGPTNWGQEWHDFHSKFNGMAMLSDIAGVAWMKSNFDRGAEFAQEQSHLAAQGFTPKEVQQAGDTALQVSRDVAGMTPMAALHLINKLMNVTQDKAVALDPKLLESYSKAAVVLSTYGHGDELRELDAAVRAGEFRGALTHEGPDGKQEINIQGLNDFLNRITAMNVVSGGDIGPSKVLQYLRSSGAAGSIISEEELTKTMALQIALGQHKAGAALQGFEQQFTAGRMSEAAANLLIQMGIISGGGDAKHNSYLRKAGMGQFLMLPGAMPAGMEEQAAKNPSSFIMEQLVPKFEEKLIKIYGDRYTHGDEKTRLMYEIKMAEMTASRIPGGTEMAEVIRNILLMNRDVAAAEAALKRDQYKNAVDTNPLLQLRALVASYQSFQTVLGKDTIPLAANGLQGLTGGLNDLTTWAQAHSAETKLGLEALAGALIALGGVGVIAIAGTLGGLTGGLLALGAAVGPAAMGIEALGAIITKVLAPLERPLAHVGAALAFKPYVDPTTVDPSKVAPGALIPWWMPLPAFGSASREPAPSWVPNLWSELGMPSAQGATPSPASSMKAAAPPAASTISEGPKGTASDPVIVHVQNQTSGADIARGVSTAQANKANRPPSGYTGTDPRIDPLGAFYGMVNAPN